MVRCGFASFAHCVCLAPRFQTRCALSFALRANNLLRVAAHSRLPLNHLAHKGMKSLCAHSFLQTVGTLSFFRDVCLFGRTLFFGSGPRSFAHGLWRTLRRARLRGLSLRARTSDVYAHAALFALVVYAHVTFTHLQVTRGFTSFGWFSLVAHTVTRAYRLLRCRAGIFALRGFTFALFAAHASFYLNTDARFGAARVYASYAGTVSLHLAHTRFRCFKHTACLCSLLRVTGGAQFAHAFGYAVDIASLHTAPVTDVVGSPLRFLWALRFYLCLYASF